jgi:hypothetical protein
MRRLNPNINVKGLVAEKANTAPAIATTMLMRIIFFAPILSANRPIGMLSRAEQRLGILARSPKSWFVNPNSVMNSG